MIAFLADKWLWIGLFVLFVAMHRGGHGCGMHGGDGKHRPKQQSDRSVDPHDQSSI